MSNDHLLQPFRLGDLSLPNRVVMAPLTRGRAGRQWIPHALMAEYDVQRPTAGLIIAEATTISEQANGWLESPGIYTDAMEAGWRQVTAAVHAAGGRIFLQLWHMGRASHSDFHDGRPAVRKRVIPRLKPRLSVPGAATMRQKTSSCRRLRACRASCISIGPGPGNWSPVRSGPR